MLFEEVPALPLNKNSGTTSPGQCTCKRGVPVYDWRLQYLLYGYLITISRRRIKRRKKKAGLDEGSTINKDIPNFNDQAVSSCV